MEKWEIEWTEEHCIATIQWRLFIADKWLRAFWYKRCSVHGEDTRADIGSHPVDAIQQLLPSDSTAGLDLPVVSLDCRQCESLVMKQFRNNQANVNDMLYYNIFLIMIGPLQCLHNVLRHQFNSIAQRTLETVIMTLINNVLAQFRGLLHVFQC